MDIRSFDDLLAAARAQPQPQTLLLLFAGASLPADATQAQRLAHERGHGGELEPLACVDKRCDELTTFADLVAEAHAFVPPWVLLFASTLSGSQGQPPADALVDQALKTLVGDLKQGKLGAMLAFDASGQAVQLG